jgi:hypothetical protein
MMLQKHPQGPAWRYFGGKWRARKRYPSPKYGLIIEPFAGAANYAWWHCFGREVAIADKSADVRNAWHLISSPGGADVIAKLPDLVRGVDVRSQVDDERCASLMGFWCNDAQAHACRTPTMWALGNKCSWNNRARDRLAEDARGIIGSPWHIFESFESLPDVEATWFIDPPYQRAGVHYTYSSKSIDYAALADWCRSRRGQVIVCENFGAEWLPFRSIGLVKSNSSGRGQGFSHEAIWTNTD